MITKTNLLLELENYGSAPLIDRILKYLEIEPKKIGRFKYFEDSTIDKVKLFFAEHPNTSKFFTELTCMKKYGVKTVGEIPTNREKTKATLLKRYGSETYNNREKCKLTCKEKYGCENTFQNEEIKDKSKKTMLKKYGVEYSQQKEEFVRKTQETNLKKFGVKCVYQREDIREKAIESTHKRKGIAREEFIGKITVKYLANYFQVWQQTITELTKKLNIPYEIKHNTFIYTEEAVEILDNYFSIPTKRSHKELEVLNFIKDIYRGEVLIDDRKLIKPYELDLFIPAKNFAIEFDGVFWHSDAKKPNDYHLMKTKLCEDKGVRLFHLYENCWNEKEEICKSMIASALGVYQHKYYARKLELKEITLKEAKEFYNKNHLQGFEGSAEVNLGLFDREELIQACSFKLKSFHSNETELVRMATKLNSQVLGGFSKLVSYFAKNYKNIFVSYVDRAWFNGKGYENSNFRAISYSAPNYKIVKDGTLIHKSKFRKAKMEKMFLKGELEFYDKNLTEAENEKANGLHRFYDCGLIKMQYGTL